MPKERKSFDRPIGVPETGGEHRIPEKAGYSDTDGASAAHPVFPEHNIGKLFRSHVQHKRRSFDNDCMSTYDGVRVDLVNKHNKTELVDELPSMVVQLILLLDAGLVVTAAFDELIRQNRENNNVLYRVLEAVQRRSQASNLSFVNELYLTAQNSGIRPFIRLSLLILDQQSHGSELSEKLEREREQLWNGRLLTANARAKEIDTKLVLPLGMMLLVLIIICISPCFMEMG